MKYFLFIIIMLFFGILFLVSIKIDNFSLTPNVKSPFKNMFDDNGKLLNVILIDKPFRTKEDESNYEKYKLQGLSFCGISSYSNFPGKIDNPYEDRFHELEKHDYTKMVSSWLHCFRDINIPENLKNSGLPMLLLTESDLKDTDAYKPSKSISKEYDFIYICLADNDKCEPGWQSYNRNWDLAKECLKTMCSEFKLTGIIVGRTNCEFTISCKGLIKVLPFLDFHKFQQELQKCRFLFVPNITDASPRVITEALTYNIPILVNENIIGGWHHVVPGVTGEFFTDSTNIKKSISKLMSNYNTYKPREHFIKHNGKINAGKRLADFLIENYPNLNNKNMKYATIQI